MKEPERVETEVSKDTSYINISYKYKVGKNEYGNSYRFGIKYFNKCQLDVISVRYNTTFPMISYIDGIPLIVRNEKIAIFISTFFILFLLLLWKLSNKNSIANAYDEVGNRPWLYPDDKTIKNPWKRLVNRLFKR